MSVLAQWTNRCGQSRRMNGFSSPMNSNVQTTNTGGSNTAVVNAKRAR
jgi:hypothetical protein